MLKYLAIFAVLFGASIYVSVQDKHAAQCAAQKAAHLSSSVSGESNEDISQADIENAERNSPSWYKFVRWPNGIGALAVILTLLAIAEQTRETGKAANAALAQIKMVKAKERARLDIEGSVLSGLIVRRDDTGWFKANLSYKNIGPSAAYITNHSGGVAIASSMNWPDAASSKMVDFDWPQSVIEPSKSGLVSSIVDFDGTIEELGKAIQSKMIVIYVQAFIEYESMGAVWHRDIGYIWTPFDPQMSASKVFTGYATPQTVVEKATQGSWVTSPRLKNGEYEKPKKPN
jgi:hypothetical protein